MKPGRTLLAAGAESCPDAELLAILLGSGGRGYSALDSANALLDKSQIGIGGWQVVPKGRHLFDGSD